MIKLDNKMIDTMKKIKLDFYALTLLFFVLATTILVSAELSSFVTDSAGVLTPDEENFLEVILTGLRDNTSVEIAVVTVTSLNGTPIEEYSLNLAHGTLGDKDKDNGILVLLAVEDREYRIEVGYGLEPVISASLAGRIGRELMAPHFKEGNYGEGIIQGVLTLSSIIEGDESWETQKAEEKIQSVVPTVIFLLIILAIFLIIAYLSYREERKTINRSSGSDEDFTASAVVASLFGRGGGGSFGGSSGGFGGFGGGSFGGGGFSGKF